MTKIINILIALFAGLAAVFGLYKAGEKEGVTKEKYNQKEGENKNLENVLQNERKINKISSANIRKFLRS
jgi:hypothetical protein